MVLQVPQNFETNKPNDPHFYGLPWNDAHVFHAGIQCNSQSAGMERCSICTYQQLTTWVGKSIINFSLTYFFCI